MLQTIQVSELMAVDGQLTQQGLFILCDHYRKKDPSLSQRLFIVQNCDDIVALNGAISKDQSVAYIVNCDGHKTPIIQLGNKFIVFDSKGRDAQYWMEYSRALESRFPGYEVYCGMTVRQHDLYSCGTDALLVARQSLRLGKALFDFVAQLDCSNTGKTFRFDEMPVEIAKYTQRASVLWRARSDQKKGLYDQQPNLQKGSLFSKKTAAAESILDYVNRHREGDDNLAVLHRREKYREILRASVKTLSDEEFQAIVMESSGVNLIRDAGLAEGMQQKFSASVLANYVSAIDSANVFLAKISRETGGVGQIVSSGISVPRG